MWSLLEPRVEHRVISPTVNNGDFQIMNKLSAVSAVAALVATCSMATAADLGGYAPPLQPVYERDALPDIWRGLYIGLNAGYGFSNNDSSNLSGPGVAGNFGSMEPEGLLAGGLVGFNVQYGALVLGAEADLAYSDISDSAGGPVGGTGYFAGATTDINWLSTLRGRLGYAVGPTLLYVTGGLAFADVDHTVLATNGVNSVAMSSSGIDTGYTVGGGIERALGGGWSTKLEYLYVDLGDETLSGISIPDNTAFTSKTETEFHTVRLGVNYKF